MEARQDHPGNSLRRIYEQFEELKVVLRQKTHPKHSSIYYNRIQLSVLGNYPNKEQRRSPFRRAWHVFVLLHIQFFFLTLVISLPESDNVIDLGQDLLWTIASFYMMFKWHFLHFHADKVDEIIEALDLLHCESKKEPTKAKIRSEQRRFFMIESFLGITWHVGTTMFLILVVTQPAWTNQNLPFHAVYPFHWHDPSRHYIAHKFVYAFQCFFVIYNTWCILYTDLLSSHCFAQLAINLKILCFELNSFAELCKDDEKLFKSELGRLIMFHQRIIGLVVRTNEVFYAPMMMQMFAAFLMISLVTFETLVARHDPTVALRFVVFMLLTFFHFSYYCYFGDMVTHESTQVAHAAYDVYEWSPKSPVIKRDIMFMLQRSQKPLLMVASPFLPLNLTSYMCVLKQCYSILTVLMESLD